MEANGIGVRISHYSHTNAAIAACPGVSIEGMTIGSIGKALANQAIESTKNTVRDTVNPPEPAKSPEARLGPPDVGSLIIGQIQAMQRPLKEDQELAVTIGAGNEILRVTEIFVPGAPVLVFAGVDTEGRVRRFIAPVDTA